MPNRLTPNGQAAPPVDPIITGATLPPKPEPKKTRRPKATETGVRYVRNLHTIPTIVRLTSKREIKLEPRGLRDDVDIVSADEQQDPKFLANRDLIFEVISVEQAELVIAAAQTSDRMRQHTPFEMLRDENGKRYEQDAIRVQQPNQSITVGSVKTESGATRQDHEDVVHRAAGPQVVQMPGSPGHPATRVAQQSIPTEVRPEEYSEFLQWKAFKEAMRTQTPGS